MSQENEKSKIAAALLAFFLGGLGIHKFYLGYKKQGVIMLLVFIIGAFVFVGPVVTGIIAFIEFIIYVSMSDEKFQQTYVVNKKVWF